VLTGRTADFHSMFSVRCSVFDVFFRLMKTPPLVLGVTLLFWGWQTGFLIPGAIMGVVLEGSRFIKMRWDLGNDDFKRIWTFCALLFLAAAVYAFADNGAPEGFGRLFEGPNISAGREAGLASARTAASLIRWMPMIFFLFIAAQAFSSRQEIPLHTISLILQRRWKQAKKLGKPLPPDQGVDVAYPYFALCLFAASVHPSQNNSFFWGLSALLAWVLWLRRPRRFGIIIWLSALILAVIFGYSGARGIGLLQRYIDGLNVQLIAQIFGQNRTDPSKIETQIGQIGRIRTSTKILIRLQPESGPPPQYLREASYRTFRAPDWLAGRSRSDFTAVYSVVTNGNTWLLGDDKPNASRVGIACYLHGRDKNSGNSLGLLPLPSGSTRLQNLLAYVLQKNTEGAVLAEGPGLLQFDAFYGPGATIDGPPETNTTETISTDIAEMPFPGTITNRAIGPDLQVPTNEVPALEKVVSDLDLRGKSEEQVLRSVSEFFAGKFTYRLWQDADNAHGKKETALGRFLLTTRAGHCEYFATATVLLLREAGIPARYAVGYSVSEQGMGGYLVRQRDAHAWCLVWNQQKHVWEDFDTTPPDAEHDAGSLWMSDTWWWARFQFSKLRWGQTHLREYIFIGLLPVLALLLFQIVRQRRRRRGDKNAAARRAVEWPGLDSEFYEIEKLLAQRGLPRGRNEALADWLERAAADPSLADLKSPLRDLLRLHYRYRFDPKGLSGADRDELRREARSCLEKLTRVEHGAAT
jgi:protein-glutamine gamma-glutamyltransferase